MQKEIITTILVADRLEFEQRLGIMERWGHIAECAFVTKLHRSERGESKKSQEYTEYLSRFFAEPQPLMCDCSRNDIRHCVPQIPMAQMDIMDGKFVANTTFADPKIAAHYKIDYELDLMVEDPQSFLEAWKNVPTVKRAYVHAEIKKPLVPLLKKIKSYGWEAGIALNPDTPWGAVKSFLPSPRPDQIVGRGLVPRRGRGPDIPEQRRGTSPRPTLMDTILFMTVYPGQNAAPFQPKVVPKIQAFHATHPNISIEVDGGVNENTLRQLLEAGVTRFAVGSAIWSAPDPLQAYKKLLKVINRVRRT